MSPSPDTALTLRSTADLPESREPLPASRTTARALAALLLAAIVSAMLVVADQIIETWSDGHLLLAWAGLWALGFAAIVLLGGTVRRFAQRLTELLDEWARARAQRRADARLWAIAQRDPRIMADLQAAYARKETGAEPHRAPFPYY
jgi:hypothetical protein